MNGKNQFYIHRYPTASGYMYQIMDRIEERQICDGSSKADAEMIVAALNWSRMAYRIMNTVVKAFRHLDARTGSKSWKTFTSGQIGLIMAALHDCDLPESLQ